MQWSNLTSKVSPSIVKSPVPQPVISRSTSVPFEHVPLHEPEVAQLHVDDHFTLSGVKVQEASVLLLTTFNSPPSSTRLERFVPVTVISAVVVVVKSSKVTLPAETNFLRTPSLLNLKTLSSPVPLNHSSFWPEVPVWATDNSAPLKPVTVKSGSLVIKSPSAWSWQFVLVPPQGIGETKLMWNLPFWGKWAREGGFGFFLRRNPGVC